MANPLWQLSEFGQSVWYDNISRDLIHEGGLARLVNDFAVRGVTSNPTIFEKAVSGSELYDKDIFADEGLDPEDIFVSLAVKDIEDACDMLRPVYDESGGIDGLVSIEVSPFLAHDTDETIIEAKHLHDTISHENVIIKIPGTLEGLPAISATLADGISVNVTLLFDVDRYMEVADAYMAGLEAAAANGHDLGKIASVASFFVSRVDTLVDQQLDALGTDAAKALKGKAAVANAKIAYQAFKRKFGGPRWEALVSQGARPQRPLWASTSTKNPDYRDTMYVEDLIGPMTVNTMPQVTVDAFADHGKVGETLESGVDDARQLMEDLAEVGIDMKAVTAQLEAEGVESFSKAYQTLLDTIQKRERDLNN